MILDSKLSFTGDANVFLFIDMGLGCLIYVIPKWILSIKYCLHHIFVSSIFYAYGYGYFMMQLFMAHIHSTQRRPLFLPPNRIIYADGYEEKHRNCRARSYVLQIK